MLPRRDCALILSAFNAPAFSFRVALQLFLPPGGRLALPHLAHPDNLSGILPQGGHFAAHFDTEMGILPESGHFATGVGILPEKWAFCPKSGHFAQKVGVLPKKWAFWHLY